MNYNDIAAYCVTNDAVYYYTKDHSFYRYDIDGTHSEGTLMSGAKNTDELLISGSQIVNTGVNFITDKVTTFLYVSDECFIVYDDSDQSIKLVGNLPASSTTSNPETNETKPQNDDTEATVFVDDSGLLRIDTTLIGKSSAEVGKVIGKTINPAAWSYWGKDLTFWEDTNGIGYMFQKDALVIVTYDSGTTFNENVWNSAKQLYSGSETETKTNGSPHGMEQLLNEHILFLSTVKGYYGLKPGDDWFSAVDYLDSTVEVVR